MNFDISKIARIVGVDQETIIDGARLFGFRIVGPWLCLSGKITPQFIEEVLHLQRMKDAADARRNKRSGNVTQPSV